MHNAVRVRVLERSCNFSCDLQRVFQMKLAFLFQAIA